jgi:hypothetical protein
MKPTGRPCANPDCNNLIAVTARVDAIYCSATCRVTVARSRNKNGITVLDTAPPQNVTDTCEIPQQNQRPILPPKKPTELLAADQAKADTLIASIPDDLSIPDFLKR